MKKQRKIVHAHLLPAVEDGVERHNIIRHNLVILSKPCISCISSDTKPANFWQASPTNNWINNTAGGSTHFGYWFELAGTVCESRGGAGRVALKPLLLQGDVVTAIQRE